MYLMKDVTRDGNPVLRKVAQKVTFPISKKNKQLADDMMEYLINSQDAQLGQKYGLRAGVGLAAPQVGESVAMASVLIPNLDEPDKIDLQMTLINPVIISESVQVTALGEGEGCLSVDTEVPGYVPRHNKITIRYDDFDGVSQTMKLRGYPAIVCQHEIDHLNGHLFYDKINKKDPFTIDDKALIIE
ncbi:peptide deformylase [Companilactobacillus sp. RD055328]|uniref:peptide deformylase n=1 Tax=Companilactobacillus sp. RD055328 TaxID=2916634 RepID=UPI001FC7BD59|nr:peptide deformylase [Companilactobacillus sp. RD055328]GKQ42826.1 peptide deformylase [Companilactobacillus sp. RD055328]